MASSIILWFLQGFGWENGVFGMVEDMNNSVLAAIGSAISFVFVPLGFGTWKPTVAVFTGLIAKENVVATFGVLYNYVGELSENGDEIWGLVAADFTAISAYSFMIFNLLCAPCFAAMGAIKREMNNWKWTLGAIGYMCSSPVRCPSAWAPWWPWCSSRACSTCCSARTSTTRTP